MLSPSMNPSVDTVLDHLFEEKIKLSLKKDVDDQPDEELSPAWKKPPDDCPYASTPRSGVLRKSIEFDIFSEPGDKEKEGFVVRDFVALLDVPNCVSDIIVEAGFHPRSSKSSVDWGILKLLCR